MKIETTFSLGQEVFAFVDNECIKTEVTEVQVTAREKFHFEQYKLFGVAGVFTANELFADMDEFFEAIKNKLIRNI